MYQTSEAFKAAVANGAKQRVWLEFADRRFSNEDILIDTPLSYQERFSDGEDLTIGQCNASQISFELNNEDHSLDNFGFGEFKAFIGVMTEESASTAAMGMARNDHILTVNTGTTSENYELVPLGVFVAPRPVKALGDTVMVEANDKIVSLDVDYPGAAGLGITYPITTAGMMQAICNYIGVGFAGNARSADAFINSDLTIAKEPAAFSGLTLRDIVSQIAEAAGANARMNRDGQMELAWYRQTPVSYDESGYTDFDNYTYNVGAVDSLHVRNANATAETTVGATGKDANAYVISDNQFLRQNDGAGAATKVLDRLRSAPVYKPASASLFADCTMESGDVIQVSRDGQTYTVPVNGLNLTWNGASFVKVDATGNEKRSPLPPLQRQSYSGSHAAYATAKKEFEEGMVQYETELSKTDSMIKLAARAITGKDTTDEKVLSESLLQVTSDGFLQTVATESMQSIFTQTYEGFRLRGGKIVLDGHTLASSLNGQDITADSLSGNACTFAYIDVGGDEGELSHISSLEVGGLFLPVDGMYVGSTNFAPHKIKIDGVEFGTIMGVDDVNFSIADTKKYKDDVSAAWNRGGATAQLNIKENKTLDFGESIMIVPQYVNHDGYLINNSLNGYVTITAPDEPAQRYITNLDFRDGKTSADGKILNATMDVTFSDTTTADFSVELDATGNYLKGRDSVTLTKGDGATAPYIEETGMYSVNIPYTLSNDKVGTLTYILNPTEAFDKGVEYGKTQANVTSNDIQIGTAGWVDSNSSVNLNNYTTLTGIGNTIQQHKNGRGYVTFPVTVKGVVKYYKIPIG